MSTQSRNALALLVLEPKSSLRSKRCSGASSTVCCAIQPAIARPSRPRAKSLSSGSAQIRLATTAPAEPAGDQQDDAQRSECRDVGGGISAQVDPNNVGHGVQRRPDAYAK